MANEQQMRMRNALAAKNVTKRGNVKKTLQDEKKKGNLQFWVFPCVFIIINSFPLIRFQLITFQMNV